MPAWLVLLIQAEPLVAKLISAALDEVDTIEEQDKAKIRAQFATILAGGDAKDSEYDAHAAEVFGKVQAAIDALPDEHRPGIAEAVAALRDQFAARFSQPLPATTVVKEGE